MGHHATARVLYSALDARLKLTALAIAHIVFDTPKGDKPALTFYMSVAQLCVLLGDEGKPLNPTTVRRNLRKLVKLGVLVVLEQGGGRRRYGDKLKGIRTRYLLCLDALPSSAARYSGTDARVEAPTRAQTPLVIGHGRPGIAALLGHGRPGLSSKEDLSGDQIRKEEPNSLVNREAPGGNAPPSPPPLDRFRPRTNPVLRGLILKQIAKFGPDVTLAQITDDRTLRTISAQQIALVIDELVTLGDLDDATAEKVRRAPVPPLAPVDDVPEDEPGSVPIEEEEEVSDVDR